MFVQLINLYPFNPCNPMLILNDLVMWLRHNNVDLKSSSSALISLLNISNPKFIGCLLWEFLWIMSQSFDWFIFIWSISCLTFSPRLLNHAGRQHCGLSGWKKGEMTTDNCCDVGKWEKRVAIKRDWLIIINPTESDNQAEWREMSCLETKHLMPQRTFVLTLGIGY